MLVLTRKLNEEIVIGDNVRIVVLGVRGDRVKIGVIAPKEVPVTRPDSRRNNRSLTELADR